MALPRILEGGDGGSVRAWRPMGFWGFRFGLWAGKEREKWLFRRERPAWDWLVGCVGCRWPGSAQCLVDHEEQECRHGEYADEDDGEE